MYRIYRFKDMVRIPPERFGEDLKKVALELLREEYEGVIDEELGIILTVTDVDISPEGYIVPGDGGTYHEATFTLLAFKPLRNEVVEGIVVNVTKNGIYVNIGPIDGMVHKAQLGDERFEYDAATGSMVGTSTKTVIKRGDLVRARIVQISTRRGLKVGMSMKGPYLGKIKDAEEVKQ
ncbi:DNA-directed RNA polymerase [Ignicoccus hospitalis]|uniref:DNA-directed RNA polymerase subunit Rpo7 n=1 Tax=Ignicoccus hospitalis (strain KIN4/I / DSM 18386 / JCM 14125) TaxID=453591 RepID=A8A8L6_IGNH4|nr:DNA-directed RNA polymerase [Ignicoccus hospitalis]ABU81268.1 DNA-directed RNA polymerase, subunit E' [Ignicoccus hospitalis KIN4/I]HIH90950.1 DNA-directed RNA polymerase [Desulfurococcaceae archaeon]